MIRIMAFKTENLINETIKKAIKDPFIYRLIPISGSIFNIKPQIYRTFNNVQIVLFTDP